VGSIGSLLKEGGQSPNVLCPLHRFFGVQAAKYTGFRQIIAKINICGVFHNLESIFHEHYQIGGW
jgi:hypothetical protein